MEVLEQRLVGRGSETDESLRLRLANARHEMSLADRYDVRLVNDDLDAATDGFPGFCGEYERN